MMQVRATAHTPVNVAQELQADQSETDTFADRMEKQGWRVGIAPSARAPKCRLAVAWLGGSKNEGNAFGTALCVDR